MLLSTAFNSYWTWYHNVTFDGQNKRIYIAPDVSFINIEEHLYSAWKEWKTIDDNSKYLQAMRSVGGDPLPGGDKLGSTFFMLNGWKVVITHAVDFFGNIYSEDGSEPFITELGQQLSRTQVSNLIDKVTPSEQTIKDIAEEVLENTTLPTDESIKNAVWSEDLNTYLSGTAGYTVNNSKYVIKSIFVDTSLVSNGDGTAEAPYNNIIDTKTACDQLGVKEIIVLNDITLDTSFKNFVFKGLASPVIDLNNQDVSGAEFHNCIVTGTMNVSSSKITIDESEIQSFSGYGMILNSAISGNITLTNNTLIQNTSSMSTGSPEINMNGTGAVFVNIKGMTGNITITNCDHANDVAIVNLNQGKVTLDSSNTGGVISLEGLMVLTDNSNGSNVDKSGILNPKDVLTTKKFMALK